MAINSPNGLRLERSILSLKLACFLGTSIITENSFFRRSKDNRQKHLLSCPQTISSYFSNGLRFYQMQFQELRFERQQ